MRNTKKHSKFDTTFIPETCTIIHVLDDQRLIVVERAKDGKTFNRHPDDIKVFTGASTTVEHNVQTSEEDEVKEWHRLLESVVQENDSGDKSEPECTPTIENEQYNNVPHRSTRQRNQNKRYFNADFETDT